MRIRLKFCLISEHFQLLRLSMERPRKLGAIIEMSGSPRESVHEDFPPRLVTTSYQVEENNYESRKCLLKFLCLIFGIGVLGGLLVFLMRLFL